ncbi:MAG: amino acid racemase [Pseudomonadota bacterium]
MSVTAPDAAPSARPVVGILGGMGPEATVLLMQRVIALTPAADDIDHVPLMVDNNTQVPSRIKAIIEGTGESPAPALVAMAERLERLGVAALAMACNTAHWYASDIEAAVGIPFLNVVTLSADAAQTASKGDGKVGLLASPAVQITGLFDTALKARGLTPVYPQDQAAMLSAIRAVKRGADFDSARATLRGAASELRDAGCALSLVACSELSILTDVLGEDTPFLDTIDILAEAIVRFGSPADQTREVARAG